MLPTQTKFNQSEGEEELMKLYALARAGNLPARLIEDAGRTVIAEGTITCLGLGPARASDLDQLTGELKLLR